MLGSGLLPHSNSAWPVRSIADFRHERAYSIPRSPVKAWVGTGEADFGAACERVFRPPALGPRCPCATSQLSTHLPGCSNGSASASTNRRSDDHCPAAAAAPCHQSSSSNAQAARSSRPLRHCRTRTCAGLAPGHLRWRPNVAPALPDTQPLVWGISAGVLAAATRHWPALSTVFEASAAHSTPLPRAAERFDHGIDRCWEGCSIAACT